MYKYKCTKNALYFQYLEFGSFEKTLTSFHKECEQKSKPVTSQNIRAKSNQKLVAIQVLLLQKNLQVLQVLLR